MRRENFYTGEVLPSSTSPPNIYGTEQEAIENASFGKYDYDPNSRLMSQPVSIYPGGYGYNQNYMYQQPVGIGTNPYQYNQQFCANPALAYQQQIQQQELQYYIQPLSFGSEFLPSEGFEDEIEKMKMELWTKEQDNIAKNYVNSQGMYNPFNNGYMNYYGVPYFNPYQYNSFNSEMSQRITEMQNEARENRFNLNMHLSRLAHNYSGDVYNDELLQERYRGKCVEVPNSFMGTIAEIYDYNRFQNMVPFDNTQMYIDHDLSVSRSYNAVISKDSNMQECFANMGVLNAKYELEEEEHRRRNGAALYNSSDNSYKYFVRKKAAERYAQKHNISFQTINSNLDQYKKQSLMEFPTLSQSAKLCDDGTLNITCNFGSKAGQTYSVHNSQESEYEKDRSRFKSFIDSIPGSIYLNNPNPNTGGGS